MVSGLSESENAEISAVKAIRGKIMLGRGNHMSLRTMIRGETISTDKGSNEE